MKLVAIKDFANVRALGLTVPETAEGFKHAGHVHKGHRFAIGTTEIYDDLKAVEKENVGQLLHARCAILDDKDNEKLIAKLDAEVAKERAAAKKLAEAKPTATVADILQALPKMIAAALAEQKKAA